MEIREIAKLTKFMVEILGQTTRKCSPKTGQKYLTFTSQNICMVFTVNGFTMEIVKIPKLTRCMVERLGQTTLKFSPEIGSNYLSFTS